MKVAIKTLFFSFLLIGILYAGLRPTYNWDMIGYMGSVIQIDNSNIKEVHETTYQILKDEIDEENYTRLTSIPYRKTLKSDHSAFAETLPYYSIRVTYIRFIQCFYKLGVPLTLATKLPSLISTCLIILVLFQVLRRELNNTLLASLISIAILYLPATIRLAGLSSPDALSTLFLLLIAIAYLYRYNWIGIYLLMFFSIATRTDTIIWCLLLLGLEVAFQAGEQKRVIPILAGLSLIVLYLVINTFYNNGGWQILFCNSFIERQPFPISMTPPLTLGDYTITMIKKTPQYLPWFLFIIIAYIVLKGKIGFKDLLMERGGKIAATCILTFLAKFILFPSLDMRFYLGLILILFLSFIHERRRFLESN